MSAPTPTEFVSLEGAYTPEGSGLFFSLSPMMGATMVVMLGLALLLGWFWGRRQRPTDDPSEAIYGTIRKALTEATAAPRDTVIASARKAQSTIKAQLGHVLGLAHGLAGPFGALGPALDGIDPSHREPEPPQHDAPAKSSIERVVIKARDVFISSPALSSAHEHDADHGHGDTEGHGAKPHGGGHREGQGGAHWSGHGPGKPLDTATQIDRVRAAIHDLSDHWSDKAARVGELRAARKQLTRAS
ncbi:MAG TPA: hypothetical protein VF633_04030 [Brevundimonas sp.]|jgi:hypothetical protein